MTATPIDAGTIATLTHAEAMSLQEHEIQRTLVLLRTLDDTDWSSRTDCPEWDVRAMYQHVLGACEAGASLRENAHQMRKAYAHRKRHGGPLEAALSNVQVSERQALLPPQIVAGIQEVGPRTVRGRRRTPGVFRNHVKLRVDGPVQERWTLGYLVDTIYLRDLWMHRVDATRAVGRAMELTADHDGRIVADVVAEWARRHGGPFALELTGPAGGSYVQAPAEGRRAEISMDAVEFCRCLAGRSVGEGLLTTVVPF